MEFNNDYDSQSDFSSGTIKEMHILHNNSYYYEKEKLMYYNNAKLENTKNQYNFENFFVNAKEKLKVEDKEDSEKEIYYINDNKRKNSVTASTEHQRTIPKIFEIKNIPKKNKHYKKRGRKRKNSTSKSSKHNKNSWDNIRNRIINNFINQTQIYINSKLSKTKPKRKVLKKIEIIYKKYHKIDELKIFFKKSIGQIFSEPLSDRCKNFTKDYNKNLITRLRNDKHLIEINNIFDQTVEKLYEKYINNTIAEFNLNKYLEKVKKEDEDYASNYKNNAMNLVKLIYEKNGRKRENKLDE